MRILTVSSFLLVLIAQVTLANDAPITMIPASAVAVVRLQAPETTMKEVSTFINKVSPGFGELAKAQMTTALGRTLSDPTLSSVDQKKDWYMAYLADENQRVQGVLLIPATDIAKMKETMGPQFYFADKNGWLACSKSSRIIDEFTKCLSGSGESIAGSLDDRTKAALSSGHLCIFVNGTSLKKLFANELASAEEQMERLLQTMGEQIQRSNPLLDLESVLEVYRSLGKVLLQGARDSKSAVVSVKVTDDALEIEDLLMVEADSQTDVFFRSQPVSDMARLKTLPQGLSGYQAISGDPKVLFDWSGQMMAKMFKEKELIEKTTKSIALMRQAKFGTMVMGGDLLPDEDAAMRYFALAEISPSSIVRDAFQIFGTGMEYEVAGIRQKQTIEMAAETIDGQSVDIMRIEQTIAPEFDPTGLQKAINEKMYGPDGIAARIVVKENLLLQTMGGGPESMKQLMTAATWSDSKLLQARARQLEKANLLMLVDMPNMIQKFAKLILGSGAIPIPVKPELLDGLTISPSYAGFSVAVEKEQLHARTSIPLETFQGFVQIGTFVQKTLAARQ